MPSKSIAHAKSRVATLSRKAVAATPEEIQQARAELAAVKIEAAIEKALAGAPRLTDERAHRIAALLLAGGELNA